MPDFLCIGAPRSGTSWLYYQLHDRKDIFLPPVKELHYFDRDTAYTSPNILNETRLIHRIRNKQWLQAAIKDCYTSLRHRKIADFKWKLKWYFSDYSDNWYNSLFNDHLISGEITPAYSILKIKDIQRIKDLFPNIRLVYILRNPVERSWSSYRKNYLRKGLVLKGIELENYLSSEAVTNRNDYLNNLESFLSIFPSQQILIVIHDSIINDPLGTLYDVVNFIGGNVNVAFNKDIIFQKINSSPEMSVPLEVKSFLYSKYLPMMNKLSDKYGGYFNDWIDKKDINNFYHNTFHP